MPEKPRTMAGYSAEARSLARAACLHLATKLGDLMERGDVIVVGGLVPSLLVPDDSVPEGDDPHVGTMDLDLGLAVRLLDEPTYKELAGRLKDAGLRPKLKESGAPTLWQWYWGEVVVEFLMAPDLAHPDQRLQRFKGMAAIAIDGLQLAFRDKVRVPLRDANIERGVWVCGPGAFVLLKALAFKGRAEPKDAYDLHYVVRYIGTGIADVARRLAPLLDDPDARRAVDVLRADFVHRDSAGPEYVAAFLGDPEDEVVRPDVAGDIKALLDLVASKAHGS